MLLFSSFLWAQEKVITGKVSDGDGEPLPDASVEVIGGESVSTDIDGNYSIKANEGDRLIISFIGLTEKTVTVGAGSTVNVILTEGDGSEIEEVVVTALGIKKEKKALTYSAQDVGGEELNKVKDTNPINSLSGKVAGMTVNRSASGLGGSVKVVLRGNSSTRNNDPLYVIDGVPLSNNSSIQPNESFGSKDGGNRDGGDALSLLNPDDIESMTVLKGASASALYGSQGANGVILITTKKGKDGAFKVNVSSNLTIDTEAYGVKVRDDLQHNVDDFYKTGMTNINTFSVAGGTERAQTYFSYANTNAKGIIPTHELMRHNFNFRESATLFNDKLKIDANIIMSSQKITNKPVSGLYFNPLVGVYQFNAENENLSDYRVFEEFDASRNLNAQRWWRSTSDTEQNPYWGLNRNKSVDRNEKLVTSLKLAYQVNDWLTLQARGNYDRTQNKYEKKVYATTNGTLAPKTGRYIYDENKDLQLYGDFIATINKNISDNIEFSSNIGASVRHTTLGEGVLLDSGENGGLRYTNIFSLQNFNTSNGLTLEQDGAEKEVQSIFGSAQFGYKGMLYLDLAARNDWSSTLSESFFYPSVGVTGVLSEMFDMGSKISFAKIRASYAEVGNDLPPYTNNPSNQIKFGTGLDSDIIRPLAGESLKPERQKSWEIGTEWRFFKNRLGIEASYYKTNTVDQYIPIASNTGFTGRTYDAINGGDIQNEGIEVAFFAKPIKTENFKWTTNINYAVNENTVKELDDKLLNPYLILTAQDVNSYELRIPLGGSYGDMYGVKVVRDANGTPVINDQGKPKIDNQNFEYLGNTNPNWNLGWNNTLEYKNFVLNFLVDGKFGGKVMSMTESIVEAAGNTNRSSDQTTQINVVREDGTATTISSAEYYQAIGGRNQATGEYTYDATNVRLAELSLGYNFDLSKSNFFNSVRASLIGRNLFFFYKDAPYDPNVSLSTGNGLQGIDVFGAPSTRSIGFNLQVSF